jgi:hypothetical protein
MQKKVQKKFAEKTASQDLQGSWLEVGKSDTKEGHPTAIIFTQAVDTRVQISRPPKGLLFLAKKGAKCYPSNRLHNKRRFFLTGSNFLPIWDRRYDFLNIFAQKNWRKNWSF